MDYSPLPSENLASPVPSEYFDFTQLFLCFPSNCAVWIENPSVFLQTNKPTKNNKNKTIATTKVESYRKFYQQFYFRSGKPFVLVAFWWPSHSKMDRNCQEKQLEVGSWMRRMALERIQILKNCQARMSPPGHRQAFRPTSHHNANIWAFSSNSFLQALSTQRSVVRLISNSVQIWRGGVSRGGF